MPRSDKVFKKRKYHGKELGKNKSPNLGASSSELRHSTSSSKLRTSLGSYSEIQISESEYSLVNLQSLEGYLNQVASCKLCKSPLRITKRNPVGLACRIDVDCIACANKVNFDNCNSIMHTMEGKEHKLYDLNLRLTIGLRAIGKGKVAAEKLCSVLDIGPSYSRYYLYERYLCDRAQELCKESMQRAMIETMEENRLSTDIAVAIDGSWQRRGHRSLNGIVSATSLTTGKVVDIEILSKYCDCKGKLTNQHDEKCIANFSGSSGAMEVTGAINIFNRSRDLYAARYLEYLGDGDSKAYPAVCESKPYGDAKITKIECIGHIQKRMGNRLRTLKTKTKKLPNGKSVGGKGRLTDAAILQIQKYYGLAIRRNHTKVEDMKAAIWAEYFHILSSNENPQHGLCPKDEGTWCKYHSAMNSKNKYDHNQHFHLPVDIMEFIKPVFKDLADPILLEKCVRGKTQNPNESLNNVIWTYIPKKVFVRLNTLKLGVYLAICDFNEGNLSTCRFMEKCSLKPGRHVVNAMQRLDKAREQKAEKAREELKKKARQSKSLQKRKLEDQFEEEEEGEPSYAPGMY